MGIWGDCKSPVISSTTEGDLAENARKFGRGNGANTHGKYCFITVFLKKKDLKRILTVVFSGLPFCAKRGLT